MPLQSTFNSFSILGYRAANTSTNNFVLFDTLSVANSSGLGVSVSLSKNGNILVVGEPSSAISNNQSKVRFFSNNGLQKFILVDTENNPNGLLEFGNIVSTSYDANYTSVTTGVRNAAINERLYLYERSTNTFTLNSFFNGANQANSQYGAAQCINTDGDFIGVCDPRTDINTVYFYNRSGNTWSLHSNISFANTVTGPNDIAINSDGSQCFVSINTLNANTNGEVQIYNRSNTTWTLNQTISASDSLANDGFGSSLAINTGDNILTVTAPQTTQSNIANVGGVYVFQYSIGNSQWEQTFKLVPDTISANLRLGNFNQTLDISNSNVIVCGGSSSVYIWKYDSANLSWNNIQQVTGPVSSSSAFGITNSINDDGNIIVVGDYGANSFAGRVYQYVLN